MKLFSRRFFLGILSQFALLAPLASCKSNYNSDTAIEVKEGKETFAFAIVSDRTGGGPETGIFSSALNSINEMQPSFVISVGDLIEGHVDSAEHCSQEWDEIFKITDKLEMPFYFTPGNHDIGNDITRKYFDRNLGKRYQHFIYNDTLFIFLSNAEKSLSGNMDWYGEIDEKQMFWLEQTIRENVGVRWTFIIMHKPIFFIPGDKNVPNDDWIKFRKTLGPKNNFTLLAGHIHSYYKLQVDGLDCYSLSATGGRRLGGPEERYFQHFMWIVMTKNGPRITNIKVNGIYGDDPVTPPKKRGV